MADKEKPPLEDLNDLFEPLAMPNAEDQLFDDGGKDWWNKALINHGLYGDRWSVYATGYKDAADIVVEQVKATQRHQDFLVYPIMFLYRQSLELTIKNLIRRAWLLLDEDETDDLAQHDIQKYWTLCQALLDRVSPGDSTEQLDHIGRLINDFCKHDPLSFAFRYPVSKPQKKTKERTPTLAGLKEINLRNVKDVMDKIAGLLGGAEAQIDYYLDLKADMMASFDPGCGY
jgi:hypothetical protein